MLWPNLIDLNYLFHICFKKRIFFTFQKEKEKLKKSSKTSIFQAFLDKDMNSSSGNFTFFTQAWNWVAVIRDQLYRSWVKLKLLAVVWPPLQTKNASPHSFLRLATQTRRRLKCTQTTHKHKQASLIKYGT